MVQLLRFRDFRLLWSAGLISMIGDWALRAGLPFEVYRLTGSTLATAAYFLAGLIPQVLFGSTAGVLEQTMIRPMRGASGISRLK